VSERPTPRRRLPERIDRLSTWLGRMSGVARTYWASVRPRSRRDAVVDLLKVGLLAAVLSVGFFAAAGIASSTYAEYGFHPTANAAAWAAHPLSFAGTAACQTCHAPQSAEASAGSHAGIGCESCHGPLLAHARAVEADPTSVATLETPTDALCVTCHAQAVGRPGGFRQIVLADHYVAACLQCHDPHTAIARRPPVVSHTLEHLPACVTCHGPEGFKARNQRHPTVGTDDAYCLSCHLAGRGPLAIEAEVTP
jgi:hypothetical protein